MALPARSRLPRLCFALAAALAACGGDGPAPAPARPRGVSRVPPARSAVPLPDQAAVEPEPSPPILEEPAPAEPQANPTAPDSVPPEPEQAQKPERDLEHELETMIGSPVDCLSARSAGAAPKQIAVSLSASVMPSGAVSRGEISAPGLEAAELACLRRRLEALHFAEPIEGAPRTVRGRISLQQQSPPPAAAR